VHRILGQRLIATPGAQFHYSNDNFQLAAAIVEEVTHRPYVAYLSELFQAAGLHATGRPRQADLPLVANTPSAPPRRLQCRQWCGADGLVSSAGDLYTWYHALTSGQILAPTSLRELFHAVVPLEAGGGAALGWFVDTTGAGTPRYFTRGNESWGPNGLLYAYPNAQLTVVVLSPAGADGPELSASRAMHQALERVLAP
jgi:CubicO group peptidase (beta-lactamase class C family)